MDKTVFSALYVLAMSILFLFGLHKYFLLYQFNKYKNKHPEKPADPEEWPLVTVQLPIFNEKYVIKRLLKSVVKLDYPLNKLHIQVLDDSTDNTAELSRRLCEKLRANGYNAEHIRRPDRSGFKAGALAYGLKRTAAEFIAIFDADFAPNPDFLKNTIPYFTDKKTGMVQTRWGHINRNYNLLTRLQAIFLDAHFNIEHLARNRSGRFFNFNGTAGVWRKQTIIDAGGWQHDTLTEDLDLSYRAQLTGWHFLYLNDVVSPAELPADMNAYKGQQHRWAKGSVQTALKLIPDLIKADIPFKVKFEAIIHLSNNFAYLLMAIPALLVIPVLRFQLALNLHWPVVFYLLMFLGATLSIVFYYIQAIRATLGRVAPHLIYLPLLISLGIGLSINNGRAALEALLGHQSDFIRTPKFKLEDKIKFRLKRGYQAGINPLVILEILFSAYFAYGLYFFLSEGLYFSMPFFILFLFGFSYLAFSSIIAGRN